MPFMRPRRPSPATTTGAAPADAAPGTEGPSFQQLLRSRLRILEHDEDLAGPARACNAVGKLAVAASASEQGVPLPTHLGTWDTVEEIPWDDLPERVVVKSTHGSNSLGVLPIRRAGAHWRYVTRSEVHTTRDLAARMERQASSGRVRGPFFAEELLQGLQPDSLPDDVKVYVFHDEVALVLMRRVNAFIRKGGATYRVLDLDGTDHPYRGSPPDRSIDVPVDLESFADVARTISGLCRSPFTRIDLYNTVDGPVFGEVTPAPGGPQWFGPEVDRLLGKAWERAEARLWADIAAGGPVVPWSA